MYTIYMEQVITFFSTYKQVFTIAHVLAVVLGMGGALITDMLFVNFAYNKLISREEYHVIYLVSRVVTAALLGIIITGICIFLSDPQKYLYSVKFITKMSIVAVLTVNGMALHRIVFNKLNEKGILYKAIFASRRRVAFGLGAISGISWIIALALGVLDKISLSLSQALGIYAACLGFGIVVSQKLYQLYESKK